MSKLVDSLIEYLDNASKDTLEKDFKELEQWTKIGPDAEEYCKHLKENL